MITVESKMEETADLASNLLNHLSTRLRQKLPQINPINELPERFDGCTSSSTVVPSPSGNGDLDIIITWPETNLGESVSIPCPCGGLDLQSDTLVATRVCGGDYIEGADWEPPYVEPCNFTDSIRELCLLASQPPLMRVDSLGKYTQRSSSFQNTELTVSVAVLLSTTSNITGEINETESFLYVINNLLGPSQETLIESQKTANTSGRLLKALEIVTEELNDNDKDNTVLSFDTFAVSVHKRNSSSEQTKIIFNTDDGDVNFICSGEECTDEVTYVPQAEVTLPSEVFDFVSNESTDTTNDDDIVVSAMFINDALFLRRNKMNHEVATVIVSASIAGASEVTGLEIPVEIVFQMNRSLARLENASDPVCSFWDPTLDENFGDWSSVGCQLVSVDNISNSSSDDVLFTCHCSHLTSFTVLMDVSYEEIEPPKTHIDFFLSAYTFIGCIVSMVSLIVAILSHIANKKLRRTEHGVLVINLSLSLIGVYAMFITAIYSVHIPVLCVVVAALLQYFFLVAFFIMTVEAVELYKKTVHVFVSRQNPQELSIKLFISCWVSPLLIVGFCLAPDYHYYISQPMCRAQQFPFYIGTIFPFITVYIFNWVMFVVIYVSIIRNSSLSIFSTAKATLKHVKQRLRTAIVLSVIFGLGWGLGLPATQAHDSDIMRYVFAITFNTFSAFQGTMIFILHCVNSKEVKKKWRHWFTSIVKTFNNRRLRKNTQFDTSSQPAPKPPTVDLYIANPIIPSMVFVNYYNSTTSDQSTHPSSLPTSYIVDDKGQFNFYRDNNQQVAIRGRSTVEDPYCHQW